MVENPLTCQIVWFKYTTQITTISVAMQNVHGFHDAFFSWFSASSSSLHTIFLRETANWMIGISPNHTIFVCLFVCFSSFWCSDDFVMDLQPLVFLPYPFDIRYCISKLWTRNVSCMYSKEVRTTWLIFFYVVLFLLHFPIPRNSVSRMSFIDFFRSVLFSFCISLSSCF